MIHKFVANDNKGNVNILEVTSTGTKLGKVAPPVEDTDAATKKYVDDNSGGRFLVTLTPTSPDYSGTMDKTVAEINAAYEAGMEIWFKVDLGGGAYQTNSMTDVYKSSGYDYPSFGGVLYDDSRNLIIKVGTGVTDDGTHAAYATTVYSLTPAS